MNFRGSVGLIQRVLPNYRAPFFNNLGKACKGGLGVFTGQPRPEEIIKTINQLDHASVTQGVNWHLFHESLYLCIQLGLLNWLKTLDPDVLIVEANPRYLRTPAAERWMHRKNRPVIGWGLGAPSLSGPLSSIRRFFRQRFIQQFDALITYSQTGAEEYAQLGFPKGRIFVAVNAVTPPPSHPLPQRPELREDQNPIVLFVGRLQERKKVDNLIKACQNLSPNIQPELVIVGEGPDRQRLEDLAQEVYPKTTFTGALYQEALEKHFQAADIFVLPGTGGLAIQQAMSYGLPIIAAEADGTQADLVRDGNGWQIPSDNLPALTIALEKALSNIPILRKMGQESYRIVAEEVNLENMVSVFVQALNRSQT